MLDLSNFFIIWLIAGIGIITIVVPVSTWSMTRLHTICFPTTWTPCFIGKFSSHITNFSTLWKSFIILIAIVQASWSLIWNLASHMISFFIGTTIRTRKISLLDSSIREIFCSVSLCISPFLSTVSWMAVLLDAAHLCWIVWSVVVLPSLAIAFHLTDIHFKHVNLVVSLLWSRASSSPRMHLLLSSSRWEWWISLLSLWIILVKIIIVILQLDLRIEVFINSRL